MRQNATEALVRIEAEAAPHLIEVLEDEKEHVRAYAADVLGRIAPEEATTAAISVLIEALKDEHSNVRTAAIRVLGQIGPGAKQVVPHLVEALKDEEADVRWNAVGVLGRTGVNLNGTSLRRSRNDADQG